MPHACVGEIVEEQPVRDVDRGFPDRATSQSIAATTVCSSPKIMLPTRCVTPHERGWSGADVGSVLDQERERGIGDGELAPGGAPRVPIGQTVDVRVERGRVTIVVEQERVAALPVDVVDRHQRLHRRRPQPLALARRQCRQPADGVDRRSPGGHAVPGTSLITKNGAPSTSGSVSHQRTSGTGTRGTGREPLQDPRLTDHVGLAKDLVGGRPAGAGRDVRGALATRASRSR